MRYLLIDRILEIQTNQCIRAVKSVALSEDVFAEHFFGYPVMPGALMIESLAQAGTALLEFSCKWSRKALLVMVEKAKFRSFVRPGDQLLIELTVRSQDGSVARLDGTIHSQEKLIADAQLTFALGDVQQFYPEKSRFLIETIYDTWLDGAKITEAQFSSKGK